MNFDVNLSRCVLVLCLSIASPLAAQEQMDAGAARLNDSMTVETTCEVVNQAAAKGDQFVVQETARLIVLAILDRADVVKNEFKEEDAQRLFQLSFDKCGANSDMTIGLAAQEAFAEVYASVIDRH